MSKSYYSPWDKCQGYILNSILGGGNCKNIPDFDDKEYGWLCASCKLKFSDGHMTYISKCRGIITSCYTKNNRANYRIIYQYPCKTLYSKVSNSWVSFFATNMIATYICNNTNYKTFSKKTTRKSFCGNCCLIYSKLQRKIYMLNEINEHCNEIHKINFHDLYDDIVIEIVKYLLIDEMCKLSCESKQLYKATKFIIKTLTTTSLIYNYNTCKTINYISFNCNKLKRIKIDSYTRRHVNGRRLSLLYDNCEYFQGTEDRIPSTTLEHVNKSRLDNIIILHQNISYIQQLIIIKCKCPNLIHLQLTYTPMCEPFNSILSITGYPTIISHDKSIIQVFTTCTKLKSLTLNDFALNNTVLMHLNCLKYLRRLNIYMSCLNDESCLIIVNILPKLTHLILSYNCNITNLGIQHLSFNNNLYYLNVRGCGITTSFINIFGDNTKFISLREITIDKYLETIIYTTFKMYNKNCRII